MQQIVAFCTQICEIGDKTKIIENGKLFIRRGDKVYDAQGAVVK